MFAQKNVQKLKILTVILLTAYLIAAVAHVDILYNILSPLVAFTSCILIISSRGTQGHYKRISLSYAFGIGIWFIAGVVRFLSLYIFPGNDLLHTLADNLFLMPNCFFALGLVLFALSEYNELHFQRMILSAFAIAFFTFLTVQKLLQRFLELSGSSADGGMVTMILYFFIVVFTIVLVLTIFYQTKFTGHTTGTNFSAVFLIMYNLFEMRMIYLRAVGKDPDNLFISAFYTISIVVFALAQSDTTLIHRKPETDEREADYRMKKWAVWVNSLVLLGISIILYILRFFDARDLYSALIAVMAYAMAYKTVQANELSAQLLYQQREENERLEKLVSEKTKELKEKNDDLTKISTTDILTGLYNRRYGLQKVQELAQAEPRIPFALYQMDLNYFKEINDTYGHDAGDLVLKEVGKRLLHLMPEQMTSVRMGGDEFLLILEQAETQQYITDTAELVCRWMDEPIVTACNCFQITASIGIARCTETGTENVDEIYKCADQAMYSIKHSSEKSNYILWDEDIGENTDVLKIQ